MIGDVRIRLTSYNGVWKKRDLKGGTLKEEKERESECERPPRPRLLLSLLWLHNSDKSRFKLAICNLKDNRKIVEENAVTLTSDFVSR